MSDHDDLLAKLRRTVYEQGIESFHILEDLVPIEVQMEYLRYYDRVRKVSEPFVCSDEVAILFSPDESVDRKKKSLALLATIPDVSAYRAIETYHDCPAEAELHHWSSMALVSSRIVVSSDLSGHLQVYISSGLGGQNRRLRFFAFFSTGDGQRFSGSQREMVEREFSFQLRKADTVIEKFEIRGYYFTMLMLSPFDRDVRTSLNAAVAECNRYGNFLDKNFFFTNVKILSEKEIENMLEKK
ncbi:MAG: hypothetical protein LBH72_05030 [Proteiniphilum sp.]|jgi:hypothetical protein|nr:hypothetical protein [Proteiniphilum sp.]